MRAAPASPTGRALLPPGAFPYVALVYALLGGALVFLHRDPGPLAGSIWYLEFAFAMAGVLWAGASAGARAAPPQLVVAMLAIGLFVAPGVAAASGNQEDVARFFGPRNPRTTLGAGELQPPSAPPFAAGVAVGISTTFHGTPTRVYLATGSICVVKLAERCVYAVAYGGAEQAVTLAGALGLGAGVDVTTADRWAVSLLLGALWLPGPGTDAEGAPGLRVTYFLGLGFSAPG